VNIDEIEQLWQTDCEIDQLDLSAASYQIPRLHAKYYPIYNNAKRKLNQLWVIHKKLKSEKTEFIHNPSNNPDESDWAIPDRVLAKNEIPTFLDADSHLIKLELSIGEQSLIVDFLEDILKHISQRNWIIKNIIEDRRFLAGEY
jgi:hypothetical protein